MTIDNARALDLIEQAERQTPFCRCGQPTVPVGRADGVWLECRSLDRPAIGRILATLAAPAHFRSPIVEFDSLAA
ncbi:MAG TPA: hypothetical protein VIM30_02310 [Candidatus Limnocylindrales bacterium]|jgi:hypothetical protein